MKHKGTLTVEGVGEDAKGGFVALADVTAGVEGRAAEPFESAEERFDVPVPSVAVGFERTRSSGGGSSRPTCRCHGHPSGLAGAGDAVDERLRAHLAGCLRQSFSLRSNPLHSPAQIRRCQVLNLATSVKNVSIASKTSAPPAAFTLERVEPLIHDIRGEKVILDADLARIYGVTTKRLNEQVKRNQERFPADFAFQLTSEESAPLRSQNATLKRGRGQHRKYLPFAFTEHGAIMAANVLNSPRAVQMSVFVVRAFVKMRGLFTDTRAFRQAGCARKGIERATRRPRSRHRHHSPAPDGHHRPTASAPEAAQAVDRLQPMRHWLQAVLHRTAKPGLLAIATATLRACLGRRCRSAPFPAQKMRCQGLNLATRVKRCYSCNCSRGLRPRKPRAQPPACASPSRKPPSQPPHPASQRPATTCHEAQLPRAKNALPSPRLGSEGEKQRSTFLYFSTMSKILNPTPSIRA